MTTYCRPQSWQVGKVRIVEAEGTQVVAGAEAAETQVVAALETEAWSEAVVSLLEVWTGSAPWTEF